MNKEVQNYYSKVPKQSLAQLKLLRQAVLEAIPTATEAMNYGIPTFKIAGKSVVGIGGWNDFVSLYPYGSAQITKFANELKDFKATKGAIQFPLNRPLPAALIKKIIKDRLTDLSLN